MALNLNGYYGDDPCQADCIAAQKEWLKLDLAAANANRAAVPWVVAFSHYPFYCSGSYSKQTPAQFFASEAAELHGNLNASAEAMERMARAALHPNCSRRSPGDAAFADEESDACPAELRGWGPSVSASSDASIKDLVGPFLQKYGVDMYLAGHWHYYESLWPATIGTTGNGARHLARGPWPWLRCT